MSSAAAPSLRPSLPVVVWQSLRPLSLLVAVLPALIGTAVALDEHGARPLVALGCMIVGVLLQAGTNVLNDAEDALTGADAFDAAGSSLAIRSGWIGPAQARVIAAGAFALAALIGVTVALLVGKPALLALGAAGVLVGWAYTAPPLRLAYRPLGELASGVPMGIGITWGTAAAQLDHVPAAAWWAAAPQALLIAAILHANNARDRGHDAEVGKRTLATYLSPAAVVTEYRALLFGTPLAVVLGVATRGLPWTCALALVPGAMAVVTGLGATTSTDAAGWTKLLISTIGLQMLSGLSLTIGLVLSRLL